MCYNNDKCQNGGTCREDTSNHSFTCDCPPGTVGDYCDTGALSHYSATHAIKSKILAILASGKMLNLPICYSVTDFGHDVIVSRWRSWRHSTKSLQPASVTSLASCMH